MCIIAKLNSYCVSVCCRLFLSNFFSAFVRSIIMIYTLKNCTLLPKPGIKLFRWKSKVSYFKNEGTDPLRPLTMGKLLEEASEKYCDRLAVISRHQNKSISFQDALNQADKLAAGLGNIGLQKGDKVGIWAQNCIEWYISFLACARGGFTSVAINPAFQASELEYSINKVGVKGLIHGEKYKNDYSYEILKHACPELSESEPGKLKSKKMPSLKSVIAISEESLRGTYNYNEVLDLANPDNVNLVKTNQNKIDIYSPVNIQLTSGTTGHPKAAVVSHFSLMNNGFFVGKRNELGMKHHKICVQVPLFHAFGTVITISASINYGATLVLPFDHYSPNKALDAIKDEKCSVIHGTPTMYVDLINVQRYRNEDISAEIAVCGGAPCSPSLFKDMLGILGVKKVKSVYGLSECTAVVFQSMFDDDEYKSTSTVGYVQEHVEVKVVDGEGNVVPTGTPGELYIRGYCNMLGYWKDEEKTKEMIDSDGWLKTGDQFVIEDGYGRVVGRLKEMIIRGGENIFPKEIEDVLNTHPDILESHVIGVPHERLGEDVCACVRVKQGQTITLDEIKNFCKGNIADFKIPSSLVIVENIPKTVSGKIQKFKLKEQVLKKNLKI